MLEWGCIEFRLVNTIWRTIVQTAMHTQHFLLHVDADAYAFNAQVSKGGVIVSTNLWRPMVSGPPTQKKKKKDDISLLMDTI